MPGIGFEPTVPFFERAETFNALDHSATVIGRIVAYAENILKIRNIS
jgi:hypothetical protein